MSRNTSVTLGKHFDGFVEELIEQGRYLTVSEVIRDGLRSLERCEERERVLDQMDDIELARIVKERRGQKEITVDLDDL